MTPESFNKWRVFPRALTILYSAMMWNCFEWFLSLPDPTVEQSAFAGVVVTGAAAWFKFYVESGSNDKN